MQGQESSEQQQESPGPAGAQALDQTHAPTRTQEVLSSHHPSEPHTPPGPSSHSCLLLYTSPKSQVAGREEAPEAFCVGGAPAAPRAQAQCPPTPEHRLLGLRGQAAPRPAK